MKCPQEVSREEYFRELCWRGLAERYGARAESDAELRQRLEYELSVIEKTGFVSYFLIVWDFINYAQAAGEFPWGRDAVLPRAR